MRCSPCIEVQATFPARLDYLLRDYAYLGERPEWLAGQIAMLRELHGKETVAAWQAMAQVGDLRQLFAELAARHYDPAYARSQRAHFRQWESRRSVATDELSEAGIADLARAIAAAGEG